MQTTVFILVVLLCWFLQDMFLTAEICLDEEQIFLKRNSVINGSVLQNLQDFSPIMCMRECLMFRICKSVNIYPELLRCELLLENSTDGGVMTSDFGIAVDAANIPENYGGKCEGHTCLSNEKCIGVQSNGHICIQYDFCDGNPSAILSTSFAIDNSKGVPIAVYSCLPGSGYVEGSTISKCDPMTKTWSNVDIVCSSSLPDGCVIPPSPTTPHITEHPYNDDVYLASFSCVSLDGQVPFDHCPVTRCTGIEQWTRTPNLSCSVKDCYTSGWYEGHVTCTVSGTECQRWDAQVPHGHSYNNYPHNYCMMDNSKKPWCHTMDPDTAWEYCPVPLC